MEMSNDASRRALDRDLSRTRLAVKVGDTVARLLITIGGIGTIVSVSTVFIFLLWVVFPLFLPPDAGPVAALSSSNVDAPVHVKVDPYKLMSYAIYRDGRLQVRRMDTGAIVEERQLFEDRLLTAASFAVDGDGLAFGFDDGSVQLGRVSIATLYPSAEEYLQGNPPLAEGESAVWDGGIVSLTPQGQYRLERVRVELEPLLEAVHDSAIRAIDHVELSKGSTYAVVTDRGELLLEQITRRENWMTGEVTLKRDEVRVPFESGARGLPDHLRITGLGENVCVIWRNGVVERYDVRDFRQPRLAETVKVAAEGVEVTSVAMLTGRATLMIGDSAGNVSAWFRVRPAEGTASLDGATLVKAHELPGGGSEVLSLSNSERSRIVAALYKDAGVRLFYVTSDHLIAAGDLPIADSELSFGRIAMAPKEDGVVVYANDGVYRWDFNLRHPEATLAALFRPVWYEGYERPEHVWQSTGGTDDFEPKLGLYPLVFGTIKATVYTLLIAVPLAILAAIYTSEFLHPRVRAKVKPGIELMASLPSVVLGFLAALVIAPAVETIVPAVLACFLTIPVTLLAAAYVWQLLPDNLTLGLEKWRLWFCVFLVPAGVAAAFPVGRAAESLLFDGQLRLWLDGQSGSATSGWFLLLLPFSALGVGLLSVRLTGPWMDGIGRARGGGVWAATSLLRFLAGLALTVAVAWLAGSMLTLFGLDPRGGLLGTYVQRNALIVGFVMGFAVIPIIYTIADDALNTVPDHLRSASLAAGATPWQTTIRVIVPTAMSGLFSAVMVGLGRAVGETMIVLMATGNTPVMGWNPFDGFRTLSANIAVELPEAVRDSTHYRTLFLAALLLFVMTFVVNTAAEIIRLRFRKRAVQL